MQGVLEVLSCEVHMIGMRLEVANVGFLLTLLSIYKRLIALALASVRD